MSTQENKALIERLNAELWQRRNLNVIDEIFADNWVDHSGLPMPGLPPGREGLKVIAAGFMAALSDTEATVDDAVAEGDKVAWLWTYRGTHTGELMGIPPTGKRVALTGITLDRVSGGQLVERWGTGDFLGFLQQLGAIPAPGQAS